MDKLKILAPVLSEVTDAHTITGIATLVNKDFIPIEAFAKDEDVMMTNIKILNNVLTYCIQFPLLYEDINENLCLATFNFVQVSELSEMCNDGEVDNFLYKLGPLVVNVESEQIYVSLSIDITYKSCIEKIIEIEVME